MNCPYCNEVNLIDAKYCAECGKPLSGDIPAYLLEEDKDFMDTVNELKKKITKAVTEKNYKKILSDRSNPITNMLITFAAWLILRTIGIIPFIIAVRILALLMGIPGLIFLLSMTYVYSKHQDAIMQKVDDLKKIDYKEKIKDVVSSVIEKVDIDDDDDDEDFMD